VKQEVGSRDSVKRIKKKELSAVRNQVDVAGRARVTRDEERVLRGG